MTGDPHGRSRHADTRHADTRGAARKRAANGSPGLTDSRAWPALDSTAVAGALAPVYARGDRVMAVLIAAHLALALALAPVAATWRVTLVVAVLAAVSFCVAWWRAPGRFVTRALAGVVLQTFCALHIYQMAGLAEMHFFYFTSVTAMILYQDARALWPGIAAIIAQHTLFSILHNAARSPGGQSFFEPAHVASGKLAWHFGIALAQSALAAYAASLLRRRTLLATQQRTALAAQADTLGATNAELEAANEELHGQALELETQQEQLQDQAIELEAQAAHLEEQSAALADANRALQTQNVALRDTNAALRTARAMADAARARHAALLASIDDAFLAVDRQWRVTFANVRAGALLGRTAPAAGAPRVTAAEIDADACTDPNADPSADPQIAMLVGRSLWALLPDVSAAPIRQVVTDAARAGTPTTTEVFYAPADRWFEVRAYPSAEGVSLFFGDVSVRHRLEAALRDSEARFRAVQEHSPNGFMLFGAVRDAPGQPIVDFGWRYANAAAERLVGRSAADLMGRRLLVEMPGNRAEGLFDAYVRVVETGQPSSREFHYAHEGIDRWFENLAVPVGDGFGVTFTDITARKQAEAARDAALRAERAARAEADTANRAKAQFLAAMSHELRTPLNAITGYAELLTLELRGPITEAQAEDLRRIKRSGQHLLVLINDILQFAKLEAGQVRFEFAPVAVATLLAEVEALVAPQMATRGVTFAIEPVPPVPLDGAPPADGAPLAACDDAAGRLRVMVDVDKARQVLLNLLTNAAKFTAAGGSVRVRTCVRGTVVEIAVIDTGVGIAPEHHEAIFEPFVQVDRTAMRDSQLGVGLGLAISRDLARGMRGDLWVTSSPGAGATFTLALPLASAQALQALADAASHGVTVASAGASAGPSTGALVGTTVDEGLVLQVPSVSVPPGALPAVSRDDALLEAGETPA